MPTEKRNIQGTTYTIFHNNTLKTAPSFLALHGFTGRGGDWADLAQRLGNSVHFVAPDLPGHGNTDAPTNPQHYSMPYIASHILQMVDTPCHLLGYSMGGRLALYLATHYPDKFISVILESASPGLADADARHERKTNDDALAEKIISKGVLWFADYWQDLSLWDSQTIAQKAYLHERRLLNAALGLANSLRGMGTGVMPSLWEKLPRLKRPVTLITGEQDEKFTSLNQTMQNQLPSAQHHIVPDAGHTIHLEQPDAFATLVENHLGHFM